MMPDSLGGFIDLSGGTLKSANENLVHTSSALGRLASFPSAATLTGFVCQDANRKMCHVLRTQFFNGNISWDRLFEQRFHIVTFCFGKS